MPETMPGAKAPLVVWRLLDGKAGHEKQSAGLVQGLEALRRLAVYDFDMRFKALFWRQVRGYALGARARTPPDVPPPTLTIGAGHRTHLAMLITRRVCGGKCVALMKPSLPSAWFDLVFVPGHDRYRRRRNMVETQGVICPAPEAEKDARAGLILVGGESRHFRWANQEIAATIHAIARASPDVAWQLCDSRRTPAGLRACIRSRDNLRYRPWAETPSDFLERALAVAAFVWVTVDSASMLYEALAARAQVGVIDLPRKRSKQLNKHSRGVASLLAAGRVHSAHSGLRLPPARTGGAGEPESRRCAQIVLERLLGDA